ncbi:hypothetical protein [Methylobacterium brachiatum]
MKLPLSNPFDKRPNLVRTALPGFDPIYYLFWYPDVRAAMLDPLHHYLHHGWKEGRDPSAGFSTRGYLAANPDVAAMNHNPLLHFINAGFAEGRSGYVKDPALPAPKPRDAEETIKLLSGPRSKASSEPLQGYVDEITETFVRGWALPLKLSDGPAEMQIFVDDAIVGRVAADEFREDLRSEGIGNARHGFSFKFQSRLYRSSHQTVIIRRVCDGYEIGRYVI